LVEILKTILLQANNSLEFLETVFQCYEQGNVFTVLKDGVSPEMYPAIDASETIAVGATQGWGTFRHSPGTSDDPAQIVFTSGTEGRPKAVVLSHRNLGDVVRRLNDVMQLDSSVREYIGVPVTYSFGLGRARAVAAAGGAFFIPERFDPVEMRDLLEAGEINAISAVPSLWRILLANPGIMKDAGHKVRWIEIGSQYMAREEKEAMKRLFPKARIIQHYGLTEASRTTFLDITETDGARLESVGAATGDAQVRIGSEGEICIRGDHVALGVLDETGTVAPITDAEGWLHTKDKGEIRDGALWYLGRLDDQINIAGIKLGAEVLEQDIQQIAGCSGDFAVAAIPDDVRGDGVLLAVTSKISDLAPILSAAADVVLKRHGVNQAGIVRLFVVPELPVTETGKVQRKHLKDAYLAQERPPSEDGTHTQEGLADTALSETEQRLVATWQSVIGTIPITPDQSFYDVGGDSLGVVQIGLAMESGFSRTAVRSTLEGRSIREIAQAEDDATDAGKAPPAQASEKPKLPKRTVESWSINATRGVMVLSVLLSHWGPGLFERLKVDAEAEQFLSFLYRMGTPGFAIVFGMGMGFFMLPGFVEKRRSVTKRLQTSLVLVLTGIVLLAAAQLSVHVMEGGEVDSKHISFAFYGVLSFYALALVSGPVWLSFFAHRTSPVMWAVGLSLSMWVLWPAAKAVFPVDAQESLLEWPRLMLVAGYSVFRVSAMVFAGLAIGYWVSQQQDLKSTARKLALFGAAGLTLCVIAALEAYGSDAFSVRGSPVFVSSIGAAFYVSFASFLLGVMMRWIDMWESLSGILRHGLQALIIVGGLALPIYVFHGLVIPVKDILVLSGLPGKVALLLPLGLFIGLFVYGWRRLKRMYFV
jgi:acyl-CoA synthetase (AMP-forming)/AMP-acid ligase II/acyl carrier protein